MAIDVSTFGLSIPTGTTLAAGDILPFTIKDGPAVVRSGFGQAYLKRMISFKDKANGVGIQIHFKNSDWIDDVVNDAPVLSTTVLDRRSASYQSGNSCPLTPNSSWEVYAVVIGGGTTTADADFIATIEVDYPSISNIVDPDAIPGVPCTLQLSVPMTTTAFGGLANAQWETVNVDIFKAGWEYALQKISVNGLDASASILVGISNAAGMRGLNRTIPVVGNVEGVQMIVEYASKLVKGPMDVKILALESTSASKTAIISFDFVKRRVA